MSLEYQTSNKVSGMFQLEETSKIRDSTVTFYRGEIGSEKLSNYS